MISLRIYLITIVIFHVTHINRITKCKIYFNKPLNSIEGKGSLNNSKNGRK